MASNVDPEVDFFSFVVFHQNRSRPVNEAAAAAGWLVLVQVVAFPSAAF